MATFTIAMTVLMTIAALGQLAISIAMLSPSKRRAINNWINWNVDRLMCGTLLLLGWLGTIDFIFTQDPGKWDYSDLVVSCSCIAIGVATLPSTFLIRYASRIDSRLKRLEERAPGK